MNLRPLITTQYEQLLLTPSSNTVIRVDWPQGYLRAELRRLQSLACELECLELHDDRLSGKDVDQLAQVANRITAQVRYLLEPLQVQEIDRSQQAVQVRSTPPEREPDCIRYFEAQVTGHSGLRLTRFEKRPGLTRQPISALITREVLAKLAQDLYEQLTAP